MQTSILVIVVTVVILIIAVVVVTIFSGGIDKFLQIWSGFSEEQLAYANCQTKCQELCLSTGTSSGQPSGWPATVKVGAKTFTCSPPDVNVRCECSGFMPGGRTGGNSS
jgi:hypothetical protein